MGVGAALLGLAQAAGLARRALLGLGDGGAGVAALTAAARGGGVRGYMYFAI